MKQFSIITLLSLCLINQSMHAQMCMDTSMKNKKLYIDVHHLTPGKVTFKDVAAAHQKDLSAEGKYGVNFMKFWVDEKHGDVYCLSSSSDTSAITETHREAHGLLSNEIYEVTDGMAAAAMMKGQFFLDIHHLGANKVTAAAVAKAHEKDLAVQKKYGVNFINYWVDEKTGTVMCLSQAADSSNVIKTHKEAHGLLPDSIVPVMQGQ